MNKVRYIKYTINIIDFIYIYEIENIANGYYFATIGTTCPQVTEE